MESSSTSSMPLDPPEGDKTLSPTGTASTSTCVNKEVPCPRECVLTVTTRSRWGTEPLAGALHDPPACPTKRRKQELAALDGATDDRPTEAPEAALGQTTDTPERQGIPPQV
jgi:hypothetical protein